LRQVDEDERKQREQRQRELEESLKKGQLPPPREEVKVNVNVLLFLFRHFNWQILGRMESLLTQWIDLQCRFRVSKDTYSGHDWDCNVKSIITVGILLGHLATFALRSIDFFGGFDNVMVVIVTYPFFKAFLHTMSKTDETMHENRKILLE
jgi:hypothetical protein